MPAPLEFYFDFSSPYAHLLIHQIEPVAARHGRAIDWRPMLLGVIFKELGGRPLVDWPLKGDYSRHDFLRSARYGGVEFNMPETFPINTVTAARAVLWLKQNHPERVGDFVRATSRAYFVAGRNVNDVAVVQDIATAIGLDGAAVAAGQQEPAIKDEMRAASEAALARGVFGAPFVFVDNEPFWGNDRLAQIERWLATGGF